MLPEIAIVGRSNVGKSSAINCLVNHKGLAKVGKTPGKTQTIHFFQIETNGPQFMLVDLPGYGFAKVPDLVQQQWAPLIETFFKSRENLRGVIMLVDSRRVQDSDRDMLAWVSQLDIPIMLVATKADKVPRGKRQRTIRELQEGLRVNDELTFLSAYTGEGKQQVLRQLQDLLKIKISRR
jgi:GTP-binding protein